MSVDQEFTGAFASISRRVRRLETLISYYTSTGPCVTFVCGATGWRGTGGTIPRTLVHETAFQLDTGGNARGAYSVDLQYSRVNADEVCKGSYSINQGYRNQVEHDLSAVFGDWHELTADAVYIPEYNFVQGDAHRMGKYAYCCVAMGIGNDVDPTATYTGGQYLVYLLGESHDVHEGNYIFVFGSDNDVNDEAFGAYSFGENNDFTATGISDYPTYTGSYAAINCEQKGDVWCSLQAGEQNDIFETGSGSTLYIGQFGYQQYCEHVIGGMQVGRQTCLYDPDEGNYWDGTFLISNGVNDGFASAPFQGMNQGGHTSQAGGITTWNVAWTTEWEFPIRQDIVTYFKAVIVGTESGAANSYCWILEGVIENDGGTTTILASTATNNYYRDVATKEWQVVADDANDRLAFQFRDTAGPDATACNLQILMHFVQVGND